MAKPERHARNWAAAAVLAATLAAGGCGGADIELNGGIFDAMGVSGIIGGPKKEPKVANRTGLVVPPSSASLPTPGSRKPTEPVTAQAWPMDPEEQQRKAVADRRKEQEAFCKKALLRAKVDGTDDGVFGPHGRCDGSLLSAFSPNKPDAQ